MVGLRSGGGGGGVGQLRAVGRRCGPDFIENDLHVKVRLIAPSRNPGQMRVKVSDP